MTDWHKFVSPQRTLPNLSTIGTWFSSEVTKYSTGMVSDTIWCLFLKVSREYEKVFSNSLAESCFSLRKIKNFNISARKSYTFLNIKSSVI